MAISALPIDAVKTINNAPPIVSRIVEEASQTLVNGTPVELAADGGVKAWDGTTLTIICGISNEDAHNFGTLGPGAPTGLKPYTGAGAQLTSGTVPNESAAVNIPRGVPFVDGRLGFYSVSPNGSPIFRGMFGNAGAPATPTVANVGVNYGLTIDSNNKYWYVDSSKTGANAVLKVVSLDPVDGSTSGARVLFAFLPSAVVEVVS